MRILIVGASGMLGHQLWRHFRDRCETWATLRRLPPMDQSGGLFASSRVLVLPDVREPGAIEKVLDEVGPAAVLNCVGIVKQLPEGTEPLACISLNALFPHRLAAACRQRGVKLVLFSTDCVFSGKKGNYRESDMPDPEDLYGRSKLLGEVEGIPTAITIRSSIVGRELHSNVGLFEWFLQSGGQKIKGFRGAMYTGLTTVEMSRVVDRVLTSSEFLSGVWHVSGDRISKYDLLRVVRRHFRLEVEIEPSDAVQCDRSLNSDRFRHALPYDPPSWDAMIEEMARDAGFYSK